MSRSPSTPTIPTSLTAASIELIELAASTAYGIRLRHVPEDQPDKEPAKPQAKKPPPKTTTKEPEKTKTFEQVSKLVVASLKKHGASRSEKIMLDLGRGADASKVWHLHRQQLLDDGVIVKEGKGRAMYYSLPAD